MTIRNPAVWTWDQIKIAAITVEGAGHGPRTLPRSLAIQRIGLADIRYALAHGIKDFNADPTHYLFLCALYPLVGLIAARLISGTALIPLLFPLVSGFALIGPLAAVGIYEMSRRREAGIAVSWTDAFQVFRSPAIWEIVKLAVLFAALFIVWVLVADLLYRATLANMATDSFGEFLHAVFTTGPGWALLIVGNGLGFLVRPDSTCARPGVLPGRDRPSRARRNCDPHIHRSGALQSRHRGNMGPDGGRDPARRIDPAAAGTGGGAAGALTRKLASVPAVGGRGLRHAPLADEASSRLSSVLICHGRNESDGGRPSGNPSRRRGPLAQDGLFSKGRRQLG